MSWGKEWAVEIPTLGPKTSEEIEWMKKQPNITITGIDLAPKPDITVTALVKDGKIEKVYNNKMPTHDPYTNPDAHIYYQCNCGAVLDPGTKSFAALNNAASNEGWKVRWGQANYIPYCVECGKDIE